LIAGFALTAWLAIFALMVLVVLFALFAWLTPAAVQIRKRALSFSRTTTRGYCAVKNAACDFSFGISGNIAKRLAGRCA